MEIFPMLDRPPRTAFDRNPFVAPGALVLADVIRLIEADGALDPRRRRDLSSAVRGVCRLLERDPVMVPADIRTIRTGLDLERHPAARVSRKTVQNTVSGVVAALRHVGVVDAPQTSKVRLDPLWRALHDRLPDKRFKGGLSRFCRFCSSCGIDPKDVSDDTVTSFMVAVETGTMLRKPRELHRRVTRLWNEASDAVPGWPRQRLTEPDYREPPFHVPWDELPAGLRADIDSYLEWKGGGRFLADDGPRHTCKPSTLRLNRRQLHGAASMALRAGTPPTELSSLADLASPRTVKAILSGYHARNDGKVTTYMIDLAEFLVSVARGWVEADAVTLETLRGYRRRLGSPPGGMTEKNKALIRKFDDRERVARLLHAPARLMEEAARASVESRRGALLAQQAVALGILIMAPMRIGTLLALRLDQHVTLPGGAGSCIVLEVPGSAVKNEVLLHHPLPQATTRMLEEYIRRYRPVLVAPDCPWLFPGRDSAAKSYATLQSQLKSQIKRLVGIHMTPHQFRHLAAKLYLDRKPGQYEVVRRLLGHKTIKTTIAFYAEFSTERASRLFDDVVEQLQEELPDPSRPRPRKGR
jgi:integrase